MSGLGFKTWTAGDVLTAADVNGYLMSQAVMVFADAAARTTALTSPSEGMVTYLEDSNTLWVYDGSAWLAVGGPVTATGTTTTGVTITTGTWTDSDLSASITPRSTSSKVLVLVSQTTFMQVVATGNFLTSGWRLLRGATVIADPTGSTEVSLGYSIGGATEINTVNVQTIAYLDSPNTTASTTYKTQGRLGSGTSLVFQPNGARGFMTLIEVPQ